MNDISLLVCAVAAAAVWLLYINGYMVVGSKRAVSFVGSDRGRRASFTACTGYIKRAVRFSESRTLHAALSLTLTKGAVYAELLDDRKQPLLRLDADCPDGSIFVEKGRRYWLIFHFQSATGDYFLRLD